MTKLTAALLAALLALSAKSAFAAPDEKIQLKYTPWTKACTQDGGRQVCLTSSSGTVDSGQIVISAIVMQRDGESSKTLRVLLPLGMQLVHGTRVIVDSQTPLQQSYLNCYGAGGCFSDYVLDSNLLTSLKTGKNLVIQAINTNGQPVTLPIPLADFGGAYNGNPRDWYSLDDRVRKSQDAMLALNALAQVDPNPSLVYAPWTKFCLKGQDANAKQVCFTGKDGRIDTGEAVIAAVIIEPQDEPKKILRITLPLGIQLAGGTRINIDGNQLLQSTYVICFANGCMADFNATPELLANLKSGKKLIVQAVSSNGTAMTLPLPLQESNGSFAKAFNGAPTDPKVFEANQKKLQEELKQLAAQAHKPLNATETPLSSAAAVINRTPSFGKRVALVIGNSNYQNVAALPNPERDAATVASALEKVGFQSVTLRTDLGRDQLVDALRTFAKQAETADWAVVYYAGHGIEAAGVNYLIPVDAKINTDRDIGLEAVPIDQVLNSAERASALRLVILDACRNNPFANQMKRTMATATRSVSRGLARIEPDAGTLVVFAAKDGETALDGDGGNSPFVMAFVKDIQVPGVEVRRLFDNVRDDVMDMTDRRQQPYSYGSVPGRQDFYFTVK